MNWLLEAVLFGLAFGVVFGGCLMVARWQRKRNAMLAAEEAEMLARYLGAAHEAKFRFLAAVTGMSVRAFADIQKQMDLTTQAIGKHMTEGAKR